VAAWGTASFENDAASEWFYLVEEAVDPGGLIASALDRALGEADHLELDTASEAIAATELSASCAGQRPVRLPEPVQRWADAHPHQPHDSEIEQALQAISRIRSESELRDLWEEEGDESGWLREIDDLIARPGCAGSGSPATLSP
jgi:hypothetical protein